MPEIFESLYFQFINPVYHTEIDMHIYSVNLEIIDLPLNWNHKTFIKQIWIVVSMKIVRYKHAWHCSCVVTKFCKYETLMYLNFTIEEQILIVMFVFDIL